jgi:hypothetical protein
MWRGSYRESRSSKPRPRRMAAPSRTICSGEQFLSQQQPIPPEGTTKTRPPHGEALRLTQRPRSWSLCDFHGGRIPRLLPLAHCAVDVADHGNDDWMRRSRGQYIPEDRGKVRVEKEAVTGKVGPRSLTAPPGSVATNQARRHRNSPGPPASLLTGLSSDVGE